MGPNLAGFRGTFVFQVPCYPSGAVYDLFECLAVQMDITSLSNVPMFFISPVADASLAYSNIMGEWLSSLKLVNY